MTTTDTESTELEMIADAAAVAYAVFRRTDFDSIDTHRNIDDEFASRIGTAAYTGSVARFADRLATKWGVRSLDDRDPNVREIIHRYDTDGGPTPREFLRTIRRNNALVVLEMKHRFQNDNSDDSDNDTLQSY